MQNRSVKLQIEEQSLNLIIDYLYGKDPDITYENAIELARAANYLELNQLRINAVNVYIESFDEDSCENVIKCLQILEEEFYGMLGPDESYSGAGDLVSYVKTIIIIFLA